METCKRLIPAILITGVYLCIVLYALPGYLAWNSAGFLLGLLAVPIATVSNPLQRRSLRFYYAALAVCVLAWIIPVKTFLFTALVLALCFVADSVFGKINGLPVVAMLLMSPLFSYITNIFTFPIRLELTAVAGKALQLTGAPVAVEGNSILLGGNSFSVDAACMGLSMMVTSLLCGIMLLGYSQRKEGLYVPWPKIVLLLGFIFAVNVVSNLFRIILLVQFNIPPGDVMHDITGILCLVVYVMLPLVWICARLVKRYGKPRVFSAPKEKLHISMLVQSHLCLAACVFMVAYKISKPMETFPAGEEPPVVSGYRVTPMNGDMMKLENSSVLVYIKSIPDFYYTDHHPTICWQGSGYTFKKVRESGMAGCTVYTGLLEKGAERLYTAWWYDNGEVQTISQLAWRWEALLNRSRFAIVNVTAGNARALEKEVTQLLEKGAVKKCMIP
ncbi:exosortase N [Chitinophaga barathri]|nr:exosortase N [Chitinophaga barathri]